MESPWDSHRWNVLRLCTSILEHYVSQRQKPEGPKVDPLPLEVQTLHTNLERLENVRSTGVYQSELETNHLRDVDQLLHRCYRTLSSLEKSLLRVGDHNDSYNGQKELSELNDSKKSRVHISFYRRTLEMSLVSIDL